MSRRVIGRPRRLRGLPSYFWAINFRYQRRIVSGATIPATCINARRPSRLPRTASRRRWASVSRSGQGPRSSGIHIGEYIVAVFNSRGRMCVTALSEKCLELGPRRTTYRKGCRQINGNARDRRVVSDATIASRIFNAVPVLQTSGMPLAQLRRGWRRDRHRARGSP